MHLYRITKTPFANDLSGEGARLAGGRWNTRGKAVLYTSNSVALAALEILANLPAHLIPEALSIVQLQIPSNQKIETLNPKKLPQDWYQFPAPSICSQLGNQWLESNKTLGLSVPSAMLPDSEESNVLINPQHKAFHQVEVVSVKPFQLDSRLLREA